MNRSARAIWTSAQVIVFTVYGIDALTVIGDFNARVGREASAWPGVLGRHGVGNMNSNGLILLTKCTELDLAISNTHFRQKDKYKFTYGCTLVLDSGIYWTTS